MLTYPGLDSRWFTCLRGGTTLRLYWMILEGRAICTRKDRGMKAPNSRGKYVNTSCLSALQASGRRDRKRGTGTATYGHSLNPH